MVKEIKSFSSLVKISHTVFAMPFAIIGIFIALKGGVFLENTVDSGFRWWKILFVIFCMFFARNSAMAFNRLVDADIDAKNSRTKIREIPRNVLSKRDAGWFIVINVLLFMGSCYMLNNLALYLSPVAIGVVLFYSYTKRFTAWCHLFLGVALSLSPVGAYIGILGTFSGETAWLSIGFSVAVLFWTAGFDIVYALQDMNFDKSNGLHSIPAKIGQKKAVRVSYLFHLLVVIILCLNATLLSSMGGDNSIYLSGVGLFAGFLVYQHWVIKRYGLERVNLSFFTANGLASIVFCITTALALIL